MTTDPDSDITNPKALNHRFDDQIQTDPRWLELTDEEAAEKSDRQTRRDLDKLLDEDASLLRDPITEVNSPDNALESNREKIMDNDEKDLYPDTFVTSHSDKPKNRDELAEQMNKIEDFYGTKVSFDEEGGEGKDAP